jgi:hypothetical protein
LTRDSQPLDEAVADAVEGTVGEQLVQVVQSEDPDESGLIRPFVVIDLRSALRAVRRRDASLPGVDEATEAASELAPSSAEQTDSEPSGGGRSRLRALFVAGVVVGLGYALRRRAGEASVDESPEEAAEEAAEGTRTIAERAATTIQQRGEMAASRIEEGSGAIAERIEEGGDEAAEQIKESGEQLDEVESEAEEKVAEAGDEQSGDAEGDESGESGDA